VFLCMLAYYVEWHMRDRLRELLFDDDDREATQKSRRSVVAPAARSKSAREKDATHRTASGLPVQSFQDLLKDLATQRRLPAPQPLFGDVSFWPVGSGGSSLVVACRSTLSPNPPSTLLQFVASPHAPLGQVHRACSLLVGVPRLPVPVCGLRRLHWASGSGAPSVR
jgi:hypothetical protein